MTVQVKRFFGRLEACGHTDMVRQEQALRIADQEKQSFLATRAIGMMIYRSRLELEDEVPQVRNSAEEWLKDDDNLGLASLATATNHLAFCCQQLEPPLLENILQRLVPDGEIELRDPDGWKAVCRDLSLDHGLLLDTIEQTANLAFPQVAPAQAANGYAPLDISEPDIGPGR